MPYGAPSRPSSTHVTSRGPHPQPASGCRLLAVGGHPTAYPVRGLRTLANPIVDARQIELELLLAAAGNGVEEPHVLEAQPALALAAVGHHDVIEGLVARPAPRQADGYHDRIALVTAGDRKRAAQKRARILRNLRILRQFFQLRRHAALERAHELLQPPALHAFHDALHLQELLQQPVHVLNLHARAPGNAPASRAVDYRRVTPLAGGHGIDDGDLPSQLPIPLVRRHGALPGHRPRKFVEQRADAAHSLQLLELTLQIHHVEALALQSLARQALGFLAVDLAVD